MHLFKIPFSFILGLKLILGAIQHNTIVQFLLQNIPKISKNVGNSEIYLLAIKHSHCSHFSLLCYQNWRVFTTFFVPVPTFATYRWRPQCKHTKTHTNTLCFNCQKHLDTQANQRLDTAVDGAHPAACSPTGGLVFCFTGPTWCQHEPLRPGGRIVYFTTAR